MEHTNSKRQGVGSVALIGIVVTVLLIAGVFVVMRKKTMQSQPPGTPAAMTEVSPTSAQMQQTATASGDISSVDAKLNDIGTDQQGVDDSMNQPATVNVDN